MTVKSVPGKQDGCSTSGKISTVLFADGTFKGDKDVVRGWQAERDGVAAAVRYWRAYVDDERTEPSRLAMARKAKKHAEQIRSRTCMNIYHWTDCEYWTGAMHVDEMVFTGGNNPSTTDQESFVAFVDQMDRWQKKIDSNVAYQKLKSMFPIPDKFANDSSWSSLVHKGH